MFDSAPPYEIEPTITQLEGLNNTSIKTTIPPTSFFTLEEKRYYHIKTLIECVIFGIINADCYFKNYSLPPHFESIINETALWIEDKFKGEIVVELVANDFIKELEDMLMQKQAFLDLNNQDLMEWEYAKSKGQNLSEFAEKRRTPDIAFVSSFSPTPTQRDFVDLGAVFQNMHCFLYDKNKLDDIFEGRIKND